MKKSYPIFFVMCFLIFFFQVVSCSSNSSKENTSTSRSIQDKPVLSKPSSTFPDTLFIDKDEAVAVFYYPDSLQLEKIKKIVDSMIFDGTMHEYFYQMRNARMVINKGWPNVKVIEAKNTRYLLFKKRNNETICIDLDTKGDPYGLFLFDPKKDPELADMMNIDNELPGYFFKN